MAAPAGTKPAAARKTARALEKEWAVPAAAAGEDRQESYESVRPEPGRRSPASTLPNKAAANVCRAAGDVEVSVHLITRHISLVTSAKHRLMKLVPIVEIVQIHRVFERRRVISDAA